jgi:hypothetical protein
MIEVMANGSEHIEARQRVDQVVERDRALGPPPLRAANQRRSLAAAESGQIGDE